MTALTAVYDAKRRDGKLISYPVADNVKIYKGALVSVLLSSGYAQPASDTAGTVVVGVAYETVDNTLSGHAAGLKSVRVLKTGVFSYNTNGAFAQTNVGKQCFVYDDNTVQVAATTNSIPAGIVIGGAGYTAQVRVDGKVS
jgi:hypothetical protein